MPIYAYKCTSCGHSKDVLQKMSDPLMTQCPACGAESFVKQVTAAGFQLKGSGWYVTDFKAGGKPAPTSDKAAETSAASEGAAPAKAADKTADASAANKPASTPTAAPPPAASPAPAAATSSSGGSSGKGG